MSVMYIVLPYLWKVLLGTNLREACTQLFLAKLLLKTAQKWYNLDPEEDAPISSTLLDPPLPMVLRKFVNILISFSVVGCKFECFLRISQMGSANPEFETKFCDYPFTLYINFKLSVMRIHFFPIHIYSQLNNA